MDEKIKEVKAIYSAKSKRKYAAAALSSKPFFTCIMEKLKTNKSKIRI